ncbi:trimeric intracellular cation channel family protein [Aeromicrobium sp. CF4.19]|uniref:trimeric intracellular cation channel family protein n=1 Tax=Aeromicrobium sp. CF4.19 TaxID=3373082 RepID=UPI003EE7FBE9
MPDLALLLLDLLGIAVFAATGALVAVRKELDVFGAIVLGGITGLGGGVLRDLLIGSVPPAALVDWRYLITPVAAAVIVFVFHPAVGRMEKQIGVLDAVGLALFCVTGAVKAHDAGLGIIASALCGMLTAIGGGMMRDVLAGRVPVIFREELYATPAFTGALLAVLAAEIGLGPWTYVVSAAICLVWRLLALWRGWRAPLPPGLDRG